MLWKKELCWLYEDSPNLEEDFALEWHFALMWFQKFQYLVRQNDLSKFDDFCFFGTSVKFDTILPSQLHLKEDQLSPCFYSQEHHRYRNVE